MIHGIPGARQPVAQLVQQFLDLGVLDPVQ
jgi:hypothetical protein